MGSLDGRITIITGAGRGLGRAHALHLAAEGARVVVNDLDRGRRRRPTRSSPRSAPPAARPSPTTTTSPTGTAGQRLVACAIEAFGGLDVLVNNAGLLGDRALVNMTEEEWDEVTTVNLKGHFVPDPVGGHVLARAVEGRFAAAGGRSSTRRPPPACSATPASRTTASAKAGVAAFSSICAQELGRYGVRSNCIAPAARTRLTETAPGLSEIVAAPGDGESFDLWDPANVSPLVAYLAAADCPLTGRTLFVQGGTIRFMEGWRFAETVEQDERWTVDALRDALDPIA